jgi:hypothetical protein
MDSESIVRVTYDNMVNYLNSSLGADQMNLVMGELHQLFPTWNDLWEAIRKWLEEHSMTSMRQSVHSFAQLFPRYTEFANNLDNSLALYPEFWNQVYCNLHVAKSGLSC